MGRRATADLYPLHLGYHLVQNVQSDISRGKLLLLTSMFVAVRIATKLCSGVVTQWGLVCCSRMIWACNVHAGNNVVSRVLSLIAIKAR